MNGNKRGLMEEKKIRKKKREGLFENQPDKKWTTLAKG